MSETFEEYLHKQKWRLFGTEMRIRDAHQAWNHQQKKIDEKDTRIAELEDTVTALACSHERIAELKQQNKQLAKCVIRLSEGIRHHSRCNTECHHKCKVLTNHEALQLAKQILEKE